MYLLSHSWQKLALLHLKQPVGHEVHCVELVLSDELVELMDTTTG